MDAKDYSEIDKSMSARINAIYGDPKRHAFYSQYDYFLSDPHYGPRGGIEKGKKTICFYCGAKKKGHSLTTEEI
jgi:hypothetical protein